MIIRVSKREHRYSLIDNTGLEDSRLSYKAKGALAYLLSKPDNWEVRVLDLIKHSTDGERAVQGALKELQEFGYANLISIAAKGGKFAGKQWVIYETPVPSRHLQNRVVGEHKKGPKTASTDDAVLGPSEKPTVGFPRRIVIPDTLPITDTIVITDVVVKGDNNNDEKQVDFENQKEKSPPSSAAPPQAESLLYSQSPWASALFSEWDDQLRALVNIENIDSSYYRSRVCIWSTKKAAKSTNWLAVAAEFAVGDLGKNKLVTIQPINNEQPNSSSAPNSKDAILRRAVDRAARIMARDQQSIGV